VNRETSIDEEVRKKDVFLFTRIISFRFVSLAPGSEKNIHFIGMPCQVFIRIFLLEMSNGTKSKGGWLLIKTLARKNIGAKRRIYLICDQYPQFWKGR